MIEYISQKIVYEMIKEKIISIEKEEFFRYGVEIFISSLITFFIVIVLGTLMNCIFVSLLYFTIFVILRQIGGGYHAKTYFNCNMIFLTTTSVILFLYKYSTLELMSSFHYVSLLFSILTFIYYAPVENKNKKISDKNKKKFKIVGICCSGFLAVISCLLYILNSEISKIIDLTLFSVAFSIFSVSEMNGGETCEK